LVRDVFKFIQKNGRKALLDGKTPAEEIDINLELGQNRWLDLLKKSIKK